MFKGNTENHGELAIAGNSKSHASGRGDVRFRLEFFGNELKELEMSAEHFAASVKTTNDNVEDSVNPESSTQDMNINAQGTTIELE